VAKPDVSDRIVELIRSEFPAAKIYVRSYDRTHTLELLAKGVDYEIRETFESAMLFGGETLRGLGYDAEAVDTVVEEVRRRDADRLALQRSGGLHAGREEPPARPMQPEPLVPPMRRHDDGRARDEAAE
jgi:CPA2 family monovalent cation:H+ antiporter-2